MAGLALVMSVPMLDAGLVSASPNQVSTPPEPLTTAPTTYTIRSGDSLAGIAYRYGVGFVALLRVNSITATTVIHPGDTLTLPAGARTVPLAAPSSATAPRPAPANAATPGALTAGATSYTVKTGDALAGIAWRHGVKLGALVNANNLTVASMIHPGQVLTVPAATMGIPGQRAATSSSAGRTSGTSAPPAAAGQGTGAASSTSLQTVLTFLRAQAGKPYKFFSAGPDTYDCSGLVVAGWKQIGVTLPHQSQALAAKGTAVDWLTAPLQPGDLVFTSAYGDAARITHVGIALSETTWIHAIGVGRTVSIGVLPSDAKIFAVRRLA